MNRARRVSLGTLSFVLLLTSARSVVADEVPCATATSPRPSIVSARDAGVGTRGQTPGARSVFDIVIQPGPGLTANPAALDAFNRAAAQWELYISDPITVVINADLSSMGFPGPLGVTSNQATLLDYTTVRDALVADAADEADDAITASLPTLAQLALLYPPGYSFDGNVAVNKATLLALGIPPGSLNDASITFNSDYPFDFDNSDGVTQADYDFESVAAHEIGHALGFFSAIDSIDASPPGAFSLAALDLYRFQNGTANDPSTAAEFTTFPRGQKPADAENTDDLDVQNPMSTGVSGDGKQASHWKADELSGTYIGAMDPTVANGTINPITNADLRALDLIGYEIALNPIPTTTTSTTTSTTLPPPVCGASPSPSGSCHLVTTPGKSSIQLKDSTTDAKDSLKWKWGNGVATALGEFEDPVNGSPAMEICVYDGSGGTQPRLGARFLAGGTCGTKPCWKASGTTGYALANKTGVPGEGITKAKYTAGVAGKAKVQISGKGVALPMPGLGLTLPVTVQLLIDDGMTTQCWQTTYSAATANTSASFKAKGP
jgi:hypothetical protein